jgi:hypothetical protein
VIAADAGIQAVCRQKKELIAEQPIAPLERTKRFRAILRINERLRPLVQTEYDALRSAMAETQNRQEAQKAWQDREFAFCLYPEEELRSWYKEL